MQQPSVAHKLPCCMSGDAHTKHLRYPLGCHQLLCVLVAHDAHVAVLMTQVAHECIGVLAILQLPLALLLCE